ncbi:MAG TPA: GAF domain-containing sensor histidine kinase [Anaerolineales bacterium]|nr:GAF domain-containing sensor histidine kinase [Anaerolineales bacterium]
MLDRVPFSLLERYQRLAEISRDLASTVDLDVLLNRIAQAAADLSNAQAASILLYDESKGQLYFQCATNLDEPLMRGLVVPVEGSIAGWIVTHRQPIIIDEAQKDPRHFGNIAKVTHVTTNSLLGVPLIAKDKVIGALEAINKQAGQFTEEDQDVLMDLAAQAAVVIENARLFQQSDLIAELVHELRTPLASLRTATHLLLRKDVAEEQRQKVVNIIQSETSRLIDMTTAFLDLARLESGRIQFQAQVFDARGLLEECAGLMQTKASENGLVLRVDLPAELPPLKADRDKIKQVIINLLSNSVKYNRPTGKITLSAEARPDELIIAVSDTGSGIRPLDLSHLFEKFYRARSAERITQGTGLGLAISKRIVVAHGGQIEVQSEVGEGTTFRVHLPLRGD